MAMPYFFPGDLTQDEYLAILAHITRQNGLWDGTPLTTENLADYRLRPAAAATSESGSHLSQATAAQTPAAVPVTPESPGPIGIPKLYLLTLSALLILLIIGGFLLWRKRG